MGQIDVFGAVWMIVFAIFCTYLACYAHHIRFKILKDSKRRPNKKYLRKRLVVMKLFDRLFPDILKLAKKLQTPIGCDVRELELSEMQPTDIQNVPTSRGKPEIDSISSHNMSQQLEDSLRIKINGLYDLLVTGDEDQLMIHKAIRFEIKTRCIKSPYDILGSRLSKTIENALQDIIDTKKNKQDSCCSRCFVWMANSCLVQNLQKAVNCTMLIIQHETIWRSIQIFIAVLGISSLILVLVYYKLWLEMGLIGFLLLMDIFFVMVFKQLPFPSKFSFSSVVICVSKAIFLTVGLYLYDHASDLEVLNHYLTPKSCNGSLISTTLVPVYSVNSFVKTQIGADTEMQASEIHTPVIVLLVVFMTAGISTISSLHCVKKQIFVNLAIEGKLIDPSEDIEVDSSRYLERNKTGDEENTLSLFHVLKRNEISITEGGMESLYQFMIQWGLYFALDYWLTLVGVTQRIMMENPDHFNISSNHLYSTNDVSNDSLASSNRILTADEVCGIKKDISFEYIWKSGAISLLSISLAQLKLNYIQHEVSLSFEQKIFYYIACICNTASYASLMVLFATNLFDYIILSRDTLPFDDDITGFLLRNGTSQVEFWSIYVLLLAPNVLRLTTWIGWSLPKCCCNIDILPQDGIDKLDEVHEKMDFGTWKATIRSIFRTSMLQVSGGAGLGYPQFLQLPTSQTLQTRFPYYFDCVSYNYRDSPQLLASFINQCTLFTLGLFMNSVFMASNIYLFSVNENFEVLSGLIDLSPSEVSPRRKNFVIFCCIVIPLGFILEYVFLYLYFKFDQGFFTVSKLQFFYTQDKSIEKNRVTGYWIDLAAQDFDGEREFILYDDHDCTEDSFVASLSLSEDEKSLFEQIKKSVPYYHHQLHEEKDGVKGILASFDYKTIPMLCFMCIVMYILLNNMLDYGNKLQPFKSLNPNKDQT